MTTSARAETDTIPTLPAPFAVPDLSHRRFDIHLDWIGGRVSPTHDQRGAIGFMVRPALEVSVLAPRRLYLGVTYPLASALPPDGGLAFGEVGRASGARTLSGNVETHVRTVFPLPTWIELGFNLGVVAPTATFDRDNRPNRSALEAIASFDPTSYVHFLPERVTLRPAGDLRINRGPLVVQGRHGLDIIIDSSGIERARLAGRLLAHAGYLVRPDLEVSVEATQVYFFASDDNVTGPPSPATSFAETYRISDDHRAAFVVGPGVRLATRALDIGATLISNLSSPLSPVADGFVALRVSLIGHAGPER